MEPRTDFELLLLLFRRHACMVLHKFLTCAVEVLGRAIGGEALTLQPRDVRQCEGLHGM
jgi:hypothetical protein